MKKGYQKKTVGIPGRENQGEAVKGDTGDDAPWFGGRSSYHTRKSLRQTAFRGQKVFGQTLLKPEVMRESQLALEKAVEGRPYRRDIYDLFGV